MNGSGARSSVTVLFCDVVGSTALGESVDAETARSLLAQFFARMKGIIEAHGGVVDKFIGDAVMAVFGVPVAHEDDALRAVRAASEMRGALPELKLLARIGINTGEAVTGTAERLVTGDAVNVAARLEQVAAPGTVLLGAGTAQLVQGTVDVSPVGSLELKGKSELVPAWELLSLRRALAEHRPPTPMIGRTAELEQLRACLYGSVTCAQLPAVYDPRGTPGSVSRGWPPSFLPGWRRVSCADVVCRRGRGSPTGR